MTFITPYIQTCQCFWYANSAPDSLKIEERGPKAKSCGYAGRLRKLGPALRWHPARKCRSHQGFYSTNNLNKQGPGGSEVKTWPAMQETQVWSLGREDPLEEGMATHSSILAWEIPWTEEPGRLQSMQSQRVRQDWSDWAQYSRGEPSPATIWCQPSETHIRLLTCITCT